MSHYKFLLSVHKTMYFLLLEIDSASMLGVELRQRHLFLLKSASWPLTLPLGVAVKGREIFRFGGQILLWKLRSFSISLSANNSPDIVWLFIFSKHKTAVWYGQIYVPNRKARILLLWFVCDLITMTFVDITIGLLFMPNIKYVIVPCSMALISARLICHTHTHTLDYFLILLMSSIKSFQMIFPIIRRVAILCFVFFVRFHTYCISSLRNNGWVFSKFWVLLKNWRKWIFFFLFDHLSVNCNAHWLRHSSMSSICALCVTCWMILQSQAFS